ALAQRRGVGGPAAADDLPTGGFGQPQRLGGTDAFVVQRDQSAIAVAAITGGVDLAHARVDHGEDRGAFFLRRLQRQRGQRGNGDHRQIQRQRHALRQRHRQAHAGKRTGAAAYRDRIQRVAADAGFGEQLVGHRQHQLGVPARRDLAAGDQFVAVDQGDGAGFGSGFDREQVHGSSMIAAGASLDAGPYAYQSMRRVRYIIRPTIASSTSAPIKSAYCSAAIRPYSTA